MRTACIHILHPYLPRVRINDRHVRTISSIVRATLYLPEIKPVAFVKRRCAQDIQRAISADVAEEGGSCGACGEADEREEDSGKAGVMHDYVSIECWDA